MRPFLRFLVFFVTFIPFFYIARYTEALSLFPVERGASYDEIKNAANSETALFIAFIIIGQLAAYFVTRLIIPFSAQEKELRAKKKEEKEQWLKDNWGK